MNTLGLKTEIYHQKIQSLCDQLDEELAIHPKVYKKHISLMFYLASLRIKKAFGMEIPTLIYGQKGVYALSGFKKPLNEFIALAISQNDTEAQKDLIAWSHYFDQRFENITKLKQKERVCLKDDDVLNKRVALEDL